MDDIVLKVASSAVLGGTISEIGGGKFANGAVTGAYSMIFNEIAHPKIFNRLRKHYEGKTEKNFVLSKREMKYLVKNGKIGFGSKLNEVDYNVYSATIDFYDSDPDLKLSFGRATVYYQVDQNGKFSYVGFYDRYDFDSKQWGQRSYTNEIITRTYGALSGGKSFDVYFNKSTVSNYH